MDARLARWRGVPSEEEEDANADAGAGSARGSSGGGGGSSLPLASDDVPGDPAAAAASAIALLASLRAAIDSDASDAARGSGAAAPRAPSSSSPLGSASWCNARLARKLSEQLEDAVAVASGALPSWIGGLLASTRFLFPLATRLRHFRATAFGTSRGVTWAQERAGAGGGLGEAAGGGGGGDDDDPGEDGGTRGDPRPPAPSRLLGGGAPRRLGTLRRERVTVRRSHVLEDAEVLMRHHARHKSVLEVLFRGEEGFGGAVTKEFYNKTAHALRDRARNERAKLWLADEHGADVAAGGAHLMCARGLFPRPIPPGTRRSEDAEARFAFVGRLVGKALLDGHMLPLPLHGAFLRAAVHGDELGAADLEEVFCERTQGGATMAWIARLAKKARAKRRLGLGMVGEEDAPSGGRRDANDDEDSPHPPPRSTKRSRDASSSPVGRAIGRRRLRRSSSFSDECEPRRGSAERKPFFSQKRRSLPPRGFDAGDFLDDAFFSDDDECDCPPKPKPKPTGVDAAGDASAPTTRSDAAASEDAAETEALASLSYHCPVSGHPLFDAGGGDSSSDVVDWRNVEAYHRRACAFALRDGVAAQVRGFRAGLSEVFPIAALASFTAAEIARLTCGTEDVEWSMDELRACVLPGFEYTAESKPYAWLLETLRDARQPERRAFLEFVAVTPGLPPGGLGALPRGPIRVNKMEPASKLPEGRTCSQELRLPAYASKEELRAKLFTALQWRDYYGLQ